MASSPRPYRADRPASGTRARTGRAAAGLLLTAGLAACSSGVPGVSVTNAESDVRFGGLATPTPTAAAVGQGGFTPTLPGTPTALPAQPNAPAFHFDNNGGFQFPVGNPNGSSSASALCPPPGVGATPPDSPTTSVQGEPKPGFYLWQVLTSQAVSSTQSVVVAQRYTNYQIRNVSPVTTVPNPRPGNPPIQTFTFDELAPVAKGHTITYTFQVKQNSPEVNESAGNVGPTEHVTAPDAGVAITAEVERDATGKTVGSFHPQPAVLLLPLPVITGQSFTGAGTDPSTGGSLTVQGTVDKSGRVATCGGYVQGWQVSANVTSSGAASQAGPSVNEVFTDTTQHGGLVVATAQTPSAGNTADTYIDEIGHTDPTVQPQPVPVGEQP